MGDRQAAESSTPVPWGPAPLDADAVLVSYAQNAEDVRLARIFRAKADGFYVDVGAGHPVRDSVTKLFYDRGWSGINVEPGPDFRELRRERARDVNLDVAVAQVEGERELWVSAEHPGSSTLSPPRSPRGMPSDLRFERRSVSCRPLSRVLDEHAEGRDVDFLKIDVEGDEAEVLRSFDLGRANPTVLVVESVAPFTFVPTHETWESLVLDAGYVLAAFDGLNRFYVPRARADLVDALAYPVSPLDNFVRADELELHQALARAEELLATERQRSLSSYLSVRELAEADAELHRSGRLGADDDPPVVLIHGARSSEDFRATLGSLARTEGDFRLSLAGADDALGDDWRTWAAESGLAWLGGAPRVLSTGDLQALLTSAGADLVAIQAGITLPASWLPGLRAAAYSDSVLATASAYVPGTTDERRASPAAPAWSGAVYIRRDALRLTAWRIAGPGHEPRAPETLATLLQHPGLVHAVVDDVVVDAPGAATPSRPAALASHGRSRQPDPAPRPRERIGVLVDGRCLDTSLSGTQVHVLGLLRGLAETNAVAVSVLLPESPHESVAPHLAGLRVHGTYTVRSLPDELPAIVHRPYQFSSTEEVELCRTLAHRLVLTHQDMILDRTPEYHASPRSWKDFRAATEAAFGAADQVAFFSRHAAWDAASDGALPPDRVNVVPIGVDHALHVASDAPSGAVAGLEGTPFILAVGGALLHKNRVFALRVFDELTGALGWEGKLVLVGDHPDVGSSLPHEEDLLRERPRLRDTVVDLGRVHDSRKQWLYSHARLVVFPSLYEGFGLVPFEAAASGTPSVYGWRSSLPEYLPRSGAALESWDVRRSAEATLAILENEARAGELVEEINRAASFLTWARTAERYVEVYRRALAAPQRGSLPDGTPLPASTRVALRGITDGEARLLDVYRRRRLFRGTLEGVLGSGARALGVLRWARRSGR